MGPLINPSGRRTQAALIAYQTDRQGRSRAEVLGGSALQYAHSKKCAPGTSIPGLLMQCVHAPVLPSDTLPVSQSIPRQMGPHRRFHR